MHYLEKDPDHDMSSLRLVGCGGSAVPVSMMSTFEEQHGVQIRQLWGMTETSPLAHHGVAAAGRPGGAALGAPLPRQGRPVCGVEARIVDDDGKPLPNDGKAVGEVEVRGPWITGSYYLRRDESKFDRRLAAHRRRRPHRRAGLRHADRPRQGRHQVRRGMDLVGRVGEPPDRATRRCRRPPSSAVPDERWQERPLAVVVVNEGAEVMREGAAGVPWPTRSFAGGCPSDGRSSTRCR